MGLARITKSDHPRNLGFTSTELQNEQWQRWVSQRASLSLSTEHAAALDEENDGSAHSRPSASVLFDRCQDGRALVLHEDD